METVEYMLQYANSTKYSFLLFPSPMQAIPLGDSADAGYHARRPLKLVYDVVIVESVGNSSAPMTCVLASIHLHPRHLADRGYCQC